MKDLSEPSNGVGAVDEAAVAVLSGHRQVLPRHLGPGGKTHTESNGGLES
jgi:hypothetical protein